MNRRAFFDRFGLLLGAASLSPTIFVPKFEPVRWKPLTELMPVQNPEYLNAIYEVPTIHNGGFWKWGFPVRYNRHDPSPGNIIPIPPYILKRVPIIADPMDLICESHA